MLTTYLCVKHKKRGSKKLFVLSGSFLFRIIGKEMCMDNFVEGILRNFFLFLCSAYCTIKIVPHQGIINLKKCIMIFFYACAVSVGTFFVNCYILQVEPVGMIIASILIYSYLFGMTITSAVMVTMIGYGVSYLAYSLAALILSILIYTYEKVSLETSGMLPYIAVGPLQFLLIYLLFRIRRFRRGIPVLNYVKYGDVGVYLSITVLIAIYILGLNDQATIAIPAIVCLLFMCGFALFYLWKHRITQDYLTQLSQREKHDLQAEIDSLHKELTSLREDNDRLSRVVHKDNKLIPAMELAVSQLLYSITQDDTQQNRMGQAQSILKQLKALSAERAGIVKDYEDANPKLPTLGLSSLDALFHFMAQKACTTKILFALTLDNEIAEILIENISESDASTLLADLIENAMIAVNHSEHERAVEVKLGIEAGLFYICVSDSGVPFPPAVLERWGIERITTHADTGGSGIGMMTIYELCQKYSASFEIEQMQNASPYRKCVSIRFDGQSAFRGR